jgi:hypothetical protein
MEDSPGDGSDYMYGDNGNVCKRSYFIILFFIDDELNDFDKRLKNNKTDGFFN